MIHKKEVTLTLFNWDVLKGCVLDAQAIVLKAEIFELTLKIGIRKKAET